MSNEKQPDFANVQSTVTSTEPAKADFGNVQSQVSSTEQIVGADAAPAEQTYTVAKGDSLSKIAKRVYGSANRWHAIFDANRDQLDDPDRIFPGQVLKLPPDDRP
jgi:nucleoid-associated protein YgaU